MHLRNTKIIFFIFAAFFCASLNTNAQGRRDQLTEAEVELVREAQAIDRRTEIFTKAIDRRFLVINNQAAPVDKKSKKDQEIWGAPPTGTRAELFADIKKILDEAINNIDDVAAHGKTGDKLFSKAVRHLADHAQRYLPQFKSALDAATDEKEKGVLLSSIEFCEQIIEASAKVPKETEKSKKDN